MDTPANRESNEDPRRCQAAGHAGADDAQNLSRAGDSVNQLELFEAGLPDNPWCSDADHGAWPRVLPKRAAKRRRYVQPQPPWLRVWIVFDVDRDGSWSAADEVGLPSPTITTVNRWNGHGHLLYGIDTPVRMERWNGRRAPANYLADVERAMTAKLGADPSYSGFICKNPLHRHWTTLHHDHPYSLGELHGWLGDLNKYTLPQRTVGVGRNVETFDAVRRWAYRLVLPHKADGGTLDTWRLACTGAAERFTHDHHETPLHGSECGWIGRSVSKWTWARFTAKRFAEIQAERGRRSKRDVDLFSYEQTEPWKREGVSRATWYRRRAARETK